VPGGTPLLEGLMGANGGVIVVGRAAAPDADDDDEDDDDDDDGVVCCACRKGEGTGFSALPPAGGGGREDEEGTRFIGVYEAECLLMGADVGGALVGLILAGGFTPLAGGAVVEVTKKEDDFFPGVAWGGAAD